MADMKRKKFNFTSPKGVFVYPKLNAEDTKFKAEGEYSVKLLLPADAPETKAFIAKLEPLYKAALANASEEFKKLKPEARKKIGAVKPNDLFTTKLDQETEEPTGEIEFKFGMKASGETKEGKKWSRKPAIFDAKGTALGNPPDIWGGTVGKVSFSVLEGGYFVPATGFAGLSLGLEAVQIIELRSGGQRDAKGYGFGSEEGFEGGAVAEGFTDANDAAVKGAAADYDASSEDF